MEPNHKANSEKFRMDGDVVLGSGKILRFNSNKTDIDEENIRMSMTVDLCQNQEKIKDER